MIDISSIYSKAFPPTDKEISKRMRLRHSV